jgi:hypothetical protein
MRVRFELKIVLGLVFALVLASAALADTVLTYTGNTVNYIQGVNPGPTGTNPCGCALDGTLTLDANRNVISYSFTAGQDTLTPANSTGLLGQDIFAVFNTVDSYFRWAFSITGQDGTLVHSQFDGSVSDAVDYSSGGLFVNANPGRWTETVDAAEPATGLFVGLGLAVFGLMRRRRKKPLENAVWEKLG